MRKLILAVVEGLALFWKVIPSPIRRKFFFFLFVMESRGRQSRSGITRLFLLEDELNRAINERALALGEGEHPKHRLVPYHQFFIENLKNCQSVIDIGCGYGAVARSIAKALPSVAVLGIDNHSGRLNQAIQSNNPMNLDFLLVDISDFQPRKAFDAVVLSNVLEHMHDRILALQQIAQKTKARQFLIRVPLFERHWSIPLRKELGINYYQDDDHKIEHTISEFYSEIESSGLRVKDLQTVWGEIWAVCVNEKS